MADNTDEKDSRIERYKQDISKDADPMYEQIDLANEDMRFVNVPGGQWEDFLENEFEDRTTLEFDLVSNYVNRFLGEWNSKRAGVVFKPDDSKTSDDDAELLNGIYRSDFRDGSGKLSLDNAVRQAAICGYGAFKLATKFEDEGDPENDFQRIEWRPIYEAYNKVVWDRAAKRPDKSDARWCTLLTEYTKDSFEDTFGKDKVATSAYEPETRWRNSRFINNALDIIYVATRYQVVKKKESVFKYNNIRTGEVEEYSQENHELVKDELRTDKFKEFVRERKKTVQYVEKSVFSGDEFLQEPKRIAGKWIPIIPVYGYRDFVDSVEWYEGLVRDLKDPARLFNMQVSQLAEHSASSGSDTPLFEPDQMPKKVSEEWADRTNKPWLPVKSLTDPDGNIVHSGPVGYLRPAQLDGSTQALMEIVPNFIRETTGGAPQDTLDPDASGKAINAIIKRINLNTQPISDNIASAIEWSGKVYKEMAKEIYTTSRMIRTVSEDGTEGAEQLLKMVLDEETGRFVEANNLTDKKFRVYADIGDQYESKREQTVEDLKGMAELLSDAPGAESYLPPIISILLDNISGVGISPLKDLNRKNMLAQGIVKPETDEEKQMVARLSQPQEDPQRKLIEAASNQANAEAEKLLAEARNLDSDSLDNVASAEKKAAETAKVISETENSKVKTLLDIRRETLENAQALPFNGV